MEFKYDLVDELPRLAWCAIVSEGAETIRVIHGSWVEHNEGFFCEGAWDGDFKKGDFEKAFFAGSGGRINGPDEVLFASPSYPLERLYSVRVQKTLYISNSLAFILSATDDEMDPGYLYYRATFHSIRLGLKKCGRSIPTSRGHRVNFHYYCNLVVSANLTVKEFRKYQREDFTGYTDYYTFLKDSIGRICANASDDARERVYTPVSTISKGYDSAASAVFAGLAGCTEAVTFNDDYDSGAEIARTLGMNAREFDRREYFKFDGFPEAEFCAGGVDPTFTVMLAFENAVQQKVLFTGFGDFIWGKNNKPVTREMEKDSKFADQGTGANGLAEFRLRTGFIHLPVPYIGMTNYPSIQSISVSSEMKPWSIGGEYDKPIPRRILEEAGVSRELFGQKKKGVWLTDESLLTEKSQADLTEFCQKNWDGMQRIKVRIMGFLTECYAYSWIARYRVQSMLESIGIRVPLQSLVPNSLTLRLILRIGKISLLPCWGISKIQPRYSLKHK